MSRAVSVMESAKPATVSKSDNGTKTNAVLVGVLVAVRIYNALTVRTFFQPDEYFQSLEPAWQTAFGNNSGAWITWEWREHLRSSLHPLMFASVYAVERQVARLFGRDPIDPQRLIAAPKIWQGHLAVLTDLCTYGLACKVYGSGSRAAPAALALTILSPWQWFCSVRTLSNSLEATLTVLALYFWPWDWFLRLNEATELQNGEIEVDKKLAQRQRVSSIDANTSEQLYASLAAAAVACMLRPTNILVWITLSISMLWHTRSFEKFVHLARAAIISGSVVLALSVTADRIFYGEWVFPPLRFLYFNLVQSLAVFYGRNRFDYYFTEGLPLLLTTALPFAAVGMWQTVRQSSKTTNEQLLERTTRFQLAMCVLVSVVTLSLIPHKEVRFIYPLLPMLHILAAKPLATFFDPFPIPAKKYRLAVLVLGIALNIVIAYYTSFVHQRGVIDVMQYLRREQKAKLQDTVLPDKNITVGFLMPCHSTPWRSHLVYPEINAWALTCEPPLGLSMVERETYLDEADVFYADPGLWIDQNMESLVFIKSCLKEEYDKAPSQEERRAWPQYLVFFEQLEPRMEVILQGSRYRQCWRGFNTHWHDDWRRKGDVVVWCFHPYQTPEHWRAV